MKKLLSLLMIVSMLVFVVTGCGEKAAEKAVEVTQVAAEETAEDVEEVKTEVEEAAKETEEVVEEVAEVVSLDGQTLLLATTTSTRDSGLLDYILGDFETKTGMVVKVIAVGTGKALQMGRDGEADVLLVHAKSSEETFVAEGYGTERFDVMYNDFVVVGPAADPAGLKESAPNDIVLGFQTIFNTESTFISRGDDSGTNKKEIALWSDAGIEFADEAFYVSAGKGMGDVIMMTNEMEAYTLTDRATYLNMMDKIELEIVLEKDDKLFNQYGVIPVNPETNELINNAGAVAFVEWLVSEETQGVIAEYGVEKFGMPLFTPNAK